MFDHLRIRCDSEGSRRFSLTRMQKGYMKNGVQVAARERKRRTSQLKSTLMENGIYHMRLDSADGEENGVVVITDGIFNGGSGIYLYQGRLSLERTTLSGSIEIRKWNREAPAPLGPFKEITLAVEGRIAPDERSFSFIGRFAGHHVIRIEATGVYLAPLAEV